MKLDVSQRHAEPEQVSPAAPVVEEEASTTRFTQGGALPSVGELSPSPPQPAGASASDRAFGAPGTSAARPPADPSVLTRQVQRTMFGLTVIAPPGVHMGAIDAVAVIVQQMVGRNQVAQQRLTEARAAIVIIPARTRMTDLPQFGALTGRDTFDGRDWETVRGSGGIAAPDGTFAIGVAEENLIAVRGVISSYPTGYSIAMHELAHTLESKGMTDRQRDRVKRLFRQQRRHDAADFSDSYAASNEHEYFAQATNAFFGKNVGASPAGTANRNGRAWLQTADPDMYAFLVEMYDTTHRVDADN